MHTPLCERLGIAVPIIQAPMAGGWTTPALAAASSEAGALGMLAGARLTADQLRAQLDETRARTSRPFGINFLTAKPAPARQDSTAATEALDEIRRHLGLPAAAEERGPAAVSVDEGVELALRAGVRVISLAMGSPGGWAARVHAAGAVLVAAVTTVAEAEEAASAGADILVAQGAEAGGHRSTFTPSEPLPLIGTMALVPAVIDAVRVPVVAAGGIMDGRGIVAARALGAGAVQLGTRFLLASESGAPPAYRRRLLEATETDSVVTDVFSGRPARGLRNDFVRWFEEHGTRPLGWPRQGAAARDIYRASLGADGMWAALYAGQGVRLARREQSAAEIVRELMAESRSVRERLDATA
jgi:nitronate monooxygenase